MPKHLDEFKRECFDVMSDGLIEMNKIYDAKYKGKVSSSEFIETVIDTAATYLERTKMARTLAHRLAGKKEENNNNEENNERYNQTE